MWNKHYSWVYILTIAIKMIIWWWIIRYLSFFLFSLSLLHLNILLWAVTNISFNSSWCHNDKVWAIYRNSIMCLLSATAIWQLAAAACITNLFVIAASTTHTPPLFIVFFLFLPLLQRWYDTSKTTVILLLTARTNLLSRTLIHLQKNVTVILLGAFTVEPGGTLM